MLPKPKKRSYPSNWARWKPFGIGEQYPNNYWEVFRAIWFSRIGDARKEWEVFLELAQRVRPDLSKHLQYQNTAALRQEIAQIVLMYAGIQHLKEQGDQFQYEGSHLCFGWKFPTPDGKARFSLVSPPNINIPEGCFLLATRRGKQFNSMVQENKDAITGATREAILMNPLDARKLSLSSGDAVILKNELGEYHGKVYRRRQFNRAIYKFTGPKVMYYLIKPSVQSRVYPIIMQL